MILQIVNAILTRFECMPAWFFPCKVLNSPWLALPAAVWRPFINDPIFFSIITA